VQSFCSAHTKKTGNVPILGFDFFFKIGSITGLGVLVLIFLL